MAVLWWWRCLLRHLWTPCDKTRLAVPRPSTWPRGTKGTTVHTVDARAKVVAAVVCRSRRAGSSAPTNTNAGPRRRRCRRSELIPVRSSAASTGLHWATVGGRRGMHRVWRRGDDERRPRRVVPRHHRDMRGRDRRSSTTQVLTRRRRGTLRNDRYVSRGPHAAHQRRGHAGDCTRSPASRVGRRRLRSRRWGHGGNAARSIISWIAAAPTADGPSGQQTHVAVLHACRSGGLLIGRVHRAHQDAVGEY